MRYQYDVMNRLTSVVQLTNGVFTASVTNRHDATGQLRQKRYGNGDVAQYSYD